MIAHLMREQARAHRSYLIWTTALLTLAIAMAAFAAFSAAQQSAVVNGVVRAYGLDGEWNRSLQLDASYPDAEAMSRAEFDAALDAADAEGAGTAAVHELSGVMLARDVPGAEDGSWDGAIGSETTWYEPPVRGVRGTVDWDVLLLAGEPPRGGEIAINARAADFLGVDIGDTVAVVADVWRRDGAPDLLPLGRLTVSGLLRTGVHGLFEVDGAAGIVAWDDSFALLNAASAANNGGDAAAVSGGYVDAAARIATPALDAVPGWPGSPWFGGSGANTGFLVALAITAAVLVVGLIGMAFAVGRSQAQARTQWVATARVLGARRGSIVAATLAEVAALGLVAGVLGVGIASFALWTEWAMYVPRHADALLPSGVDTPAWTQAAFIGVAVVVAAIMGAIPAFWAARVSPAAALKPMTPVTQAELSRRVSPAWIYGIWGACLGALTWLVTLEGGTDAWMWTVWTLVLITGVTTIAALVEANRWLVTRLGQRLARSYRPWALAAGDGLLGHMRQAAVPAAVLGIASMTLAGTTTWTVLYSWGQNFAGDAWMWRGLPGWPQLPEALGVPGDYSPGSTSGALLHGIAALGSAVLVLVALAAFASSALAQRSDSTARRALGLSGTSARAAAAAQFGLPLALGAVLGAAVGVAAITVTYRGHAWLSVPAATYTGAEIPDRVGAAWAAANLGHVVIPVAFSLAITLACIALGSLAAALMVRLDKPTRAREDALV